MYFAAANILYLIYNFYQCKNYKSKGKAKDKIIDSSAENLMGLKQSTNIVLVKIK